MDNAKKIQTWRDANPDRRITEQAMIEILGVDPLHSADLTGANLQGAFLPCADMTNANLTDANLNGADLWGANLRDANLWDADLTTADLRDANLRGADVRGADLRGTDLRGANLTYCTGGVTQIDNLYPYPATLQPTIDGWYARVGCWYGTLNELHEIASSDKDEDWPEATGAEREWRLPLLQAILSVFDAQVISHPDIITELNINELNNRWGK